MTMTKPAQTPVAAPVPTTTMTTPPAPPPPAPPPTPSPAPPAPPSASSPPPTPQPPILTDESGFLSAVHANIPIGWIPEGAITPAGDTVWPSNSQVISEGYEACRVQAQYPGNQRRAAVAFYAEYGRDASRGDVPITFMNYASTFLCNPER